MSKSKELKKLKNLAGRQSWNGVKPVTRVIPNKKKAVESRKAKHKGRRDGAGHYFFGVGPSLFLDFASAV